MVKKKKGQDLAKHLVLDEIDKTMIQKILVNPAITDQELADHFRMNRRQINLRRNLPLFQETLDRMIDEQSKDAIQLLQEALPKAMRYLISVVRDKTLDDRLRVHAAGKLIDKGLPSKVESKVEGSIKSEPSGTVQDIYDKMGEDEQRKLMDTIKQITDKRSS
jgi:hypothetical protein